MCEEHASIPARFRPLEVGERVPRPFRGAIRRCDLGGGMRNDDVAHVDS